MVTSSGQETGCAPANNGLEVLSSAGSDSQEVMREVKVWRSWETLSRPMPEVVQMTASKLC